MDWEVKGRSIPNPLERRDNKKVKKKWCPNWKVVISRADGVYAWMCAVNVDGSDKKMKTEAGI